MEIVVFWFRRDLRLHDNNGLYHALRSGKPVLPVFIFDRSILEKLNFRDDPRVTFIHRRITALKNELESLSSSFKVFHCHPEEAFTEIVNEFRIDEVFTNSDYEPDTIKRDTQIDEFLRTRNIRFRSFKDHVIFEKNEVLKDDGKPYTVFTPYSLKWKKNLTSGSYAQKPSERYTGNFIKCRPFFMPSLKEIGFEFSSVSVPSSEIQLPVITNYGKTHDFPSIIGTTRLGIHLRFGTISIRQLVAVAHENSEVFLNELIWRDFFISILWHFPHVTEGPFKQKYRFIEWRNNEAEFKSWCNGETGYPLVDAGMREINSTGFMHNRVRMVVASFLSKHLLIDWRWGEAYFAERLLDFELASNNGNWQWAAGCGCDAAPYFRIFNPTAQQSKFDMAGEYIKKWIPEPGTLKYPEPIVEHSFARERALKVYKRALE